MQTEISIHGTDFYINNQPTYAGRYHEGRRVEGLLLNSRMVQAIFDDENPETRPNWRYPDTRAWDPDRNTTEFCQALPVYRAHGLLAVTVGLQGGGAIYTPEIYDHYQNSAFHWDGSLKPAYLTRLKQVLAAADQAGMAVILNYFYGKQAENFENEAAVKHAALNITQWLLDSRYRNILVDVFNEVQEGPGLLQSERIHELIRMVQSTQKEGRRLLTGTSIHPWKLRPAGEWPALVDFYLPHGNDSYADKLRAEIRAIKTWPEYRQNPRPILINEDSIDLPNLDVAVDEGASWGFYSQGFGSQYADTRWHWSMHDREETYEKLSGFQTPPINWGINTDFKKMFFNRVKAITAGK